METKEYTTIDKSNWPRGEWDNEPDKIQFEDAETKLPCLIVRQSNHGALCGYVGVPEGHPFFKKDYDACELGVHGGLTFSNFCQENEKESEGVCHIPAPGDPDRVWWLGFDCFHAFDLAPATNRYSDFFPDVADMFSGTYRNIDYVKDEIKSLAKQLKAAA